MRAIMALCLVTIAAIGCSLVPQQSAVPSLSAEVCPGADLSGTLARSADGTALVVTTEFGDQQVRWPDGYVTEHGRTLILRDANGNVVAAEGDAIHVGGGMDGANEFFIACGYVSTNPPSSNLSRRSPSEPAW